MTNIVSNVTAHGVVPTDALSRLDRHLRAPEDRTRDRILVGAKRQFLAQGFARVPIGEVCLSLKISKKTFYKYFPNKEELVYGIVASNAKLFFPKLSDILAAEAAPDVRLGEMFDSYLDMVAQNFSAIFLSDLQVMMPELWQVIDSVRKEVLANTIDIIKEGQRQGVFRKDIDAEKLSRVFSLILERVFDPKVLYENGLQHPEAFQAFFDILRWGICEPSQERHMR